MSDSQENGDLPDWLVRLARAVARDCQRPGRYVVEFEVSDHRRRVDMLVLARVELLRNMPVDGRL